MGQVYYRNVQEVLYLHHGRKLFDTPDVFLIYEPVNLVNKQKSHYRYEGPNESPQEARVGDVLEKLSPLFCGICPSTLTVPRLG